MPFRILQTTARSILSPTTGFIREAGFTHSLTPARNCTYGCLYCYVPTLGIYGGLRPEDVRHWGQYSVLKENAAELLARALRPGQIIYCSPLVDPYQPVEKDAGLMRAILAAVMDSPPKLFVVQTRGPLILRDLDLLTALARRTRVRVSFSLTTDRDDVRARMEPHCESNEERLATIAALRRAGLDVFATLAPLLPCDPERLATLALDATDNDLIGDPLHVRSVKKHGAISREAAHRTAHHHGWDDWFRPAFQMEVVQQIKRMAELRGRRFRTGPEGFRGLTEDYSGGSREKEALDRTTTR